MIPGELDCDDGELELNAGREKRELEVINNGDRPIQVGSHYHFADVNDELSFDRVPRRGFASKSRAGKSWRFESQASDTVALAGERRVPGLRLRDEPER